MTVLPQPETVQPRLEPYGQAVVEGYRSFYASKSESDFSLLMEAILRALSELPENDAELREEWKLQEDLSIDSIGLAEAAFLVEDLFGVRLDNAALQEIQTVGDLRSALAAHVWKTRSERSTHGA